jgi:hypothetical protein
MQATGVRLFIQDFGTAGTRTHFERLVKTFTEDGTLKESQFNNFRTPRIPAQDLPHSTELNDILWKLTDDLVARGFETETIAGALVNVSGKIAINMIEAGGGLYAAGLVITSLKELRAETEERVQAPDGIDEFVRSLFDHFRDCTYVFKEKSGLDFEHLLPGIQRADR